MISILAKKTFQKTFRKIKLSHIFFLVYLALASIMVFPIFLGKTNAYIDQLLHIPPMYTFWRSQVLQGIFPFWNPYILNGLPFFSNPAHPALSIFNLAFLIFPDSFVASNFLFLILITLASQGAYITGKVLGFGKRISFWLGLVFGLSGVVMNSAQDINSMIAVSLTPWLVYGLLSDMYSNRRWLYPKFSLITFIFLTSAHPQYFYYNMFLCFLLTMFWGDNLLTKNTFKRLTAFVISLALGIGMASFQIIPTIELIQNSHRSENIANNQIQGIQFRELPRLIFPVIYGQRNDGNSWGPGSDISTGYASVKGALSVSVFVGILFAIKVRKLQQKDAKFFVIFLITSVFGILISLGSESVFFRLFYDSFPGFNSFRSPHRILTLYSLSMCLMAAYGWKQVSLAKIKIRSKTFFTFYLMLSFCITGLIVMPNIWYLFFDYLWYTFRGEPFLGTYVYSISKIQEISRLLWLSGLIFSLGSLSGLYFYKSFLRRNSFSLAICFLIFESFIGMRGNFIWVPITELYVEEENLEIIKSVGNTYSRKASLSDLTDFIGIWPYFNHIRVQNQTLSSSPIGPDEFNNWEQLSNHLQSVPSNTNLLYGIPSVTGYVSIMPKSYRDFWDSNSMNSIDYKTLDDERLNQSALEYLIADKEHRNLVSQYPQFILARSTKDIDVFQNSLAEPRAKIVDNFGLEMDTDILIRDIDVNTVRISFSEPLEGTLILRDYYYPGWKAFSGNLKLEIKPFDQIFRSVKTTSDMTEITFVYKPESFILGVITSIISYSAFLSLVLKSKSNV